MLVVILQTLLLGLIWGITPWPVILLFTAKLFSGERFGMYAWFGYALLTWLIEFLIGLFVVSTANMFQIPVFVFSILGIFGGVFLFYLAFALHRSTNYRENSSPILNTKYIIVYMLFNGPLRLFRITVCLPVAMQLKWYLTYGQFVFVGIFEFAMVVGLSSIIWLLYIGRKFFLQKWHQNLICKVLSFVLLWLWVKLIVDWMLFIF